jgi:hypothetical protein
MTARVSVQTQALRGLADRLTTAARALRGEPLPAGAEVAAGDPVLAASLHRFGSVAGRARAELDDDLARMADTLRLVADAYEEVERESSARFGLWRRLGG